uniref:Ubiquitinyl hydrolase 1 n=1 Tax=Romanomermis culicivorax TaxID=13658 RepID=A0A915JRX0_ROMCU
SHGANSSTPTLCTHLKRNVDTNTLNKILRKSTDFNCDECQREGLKKDERGPVWACMQCGHKGCGRYSEHAHAVSHSEAPRSSSHRIVLNLDTLAIWCYDCDDEVPRKSCPPSIRTMLHTLHLFIKKSLESPISEANIIEPKQPEEKLSSALKGKKFTKQECKLNLAQVPIKGLSNMGNTCFFNSVVQNLMQTNCLRQMLLDTSIEKGSKMSLIPHLASEKLDDYDKLISNGNDQTKSEDSR